MSAIRSGNCLRDTVGASDECKAGSLQLASNSCTRNSPVNYNDRYSDSGNSARDRREICKMQIARGDEHAAIVSVNRAGNEVH